ncbi:MAG: VOC family protein [Phycisphaerae bacterium]|nr:VOC family protein [Tepidisphaeraceae bacterium]
MDLVASLCLVADDFDGAIQFYRDVLGCFRVAQDFTPPSGIRRVALRHLPLPFEIVLFPAHSKAFGPISARQVGLPREIPLLSVPVVDFEDAVDRLQSNGAAHEVFDLPYARQLRTWDPFGNCVYLVDSKFERDEPD